MSIEQAKVAIAEAVSRADEAVGFARRGSEPIAAATGHITSATQGTSHHLPGEAVASLREAGSAAEEGAALLASGMRAARQYGESGL